MKSIRLTQAIRADIVSAMAKSKREELRNQLMNIKEVVAEARLKRLGSEVTRLYSEQPALFQNPGEIAIMDSNQGSHRLIYITAPVVGWNLDDNRDHKTLDYNYLDQIRKAVRIYLSDKEELNDRIKNLKAVLSKYNTSKKLMEEFKDAFDAIPPHYLKECDTVALVSLDPLAKYFQTEKK